jgi:quercetin dioxygenase-like cupin family protein
VLSGELTVRVGLEDDHHVVPAGTLVCVPAFVVHGFRNGSDAEVTYLNLHAPGVGFADYLRGRLSPEEFDQWDPPQEGIRPASEARIGEREQISERAVLLWESDTVAVAEISGVEVARHVHDRHADSFYVLEGTVAFTAGADSFTAGPGTWVQVPPGVPHSISAPKARFLNLHSPSCGFGAFLRGDGAAFDQRQV